jgi:hypothetical protein
LAGADRSPATALRLRLFPARAGQGRAAKRFFWNTIMANLITAARALYNLDNRATTAAEDDTLDALIAAASAAIERLCGRSFVSASFDKLYDGWFHRDLMLEQFPIISVERIAFGPVGVLRIENTSAANQRATVQVTSTGVILTRVASGVSSSSTVTFAGNVTLSAVAAAINALGNGWSASVIDAADAKRASADLRSLQGALNAKDAPAELVLHKEELYDFFVDAPRGILRRPARWCGGQGFWRVIYTAGYATVPEDIQEACAQWVAHLFWQTKRDPGLAHEAVTGALSRTPQHEMPTTTRVLLEPYRTFHL